MEIAHVLFATSDYLEQTQVTDSQWMMYLGQDRTFDPYARIHALWR